jgi:hypothetical protein
MPEKINFDSILHSPTKIVEIAVATMIAVSMNDILNDVMLKYSFSTSNINN